MGLPALASGLGCDPPVVARDVDERAVQEPQPLGPLDVAQTYQGDRLADLVYVLPDGRREPIQDEAYADWMWDRALGSLCLRSELTVDGRVRCFPANEPEVDTYVDDACSVTSLDERTPGCPTRFAHGPLLRGGEPVEMRSFRETARPRPDDSDRHAFGVDGCESRSRGDLGPVLAVRVRDDELVGGDVTRTTLTAQLTDVLERFDDGTVRQRRVATPTCGIVQFDAAEPAERRCVPGLERDAIVGVGPSPAFVAFRDPGCTERFYRNDGVDSYADHPYVLFVPYMGDPLHFVRSPVGPRTELPEAYYVRTPDGCREQTRGEQDRPPLVVPFGPIVPPETFPLLRRVVVGEGRLRSVRWVDGDGRAWPNRLRGRTRGDANDGAYFVDMETNERCTVVPTALGHRCLPNRIRGLGAREFFLEDSCETPVHRSAFGYTHLSYDDGVEPAPFGRSCGTVGWTHVVEVRRLGPPLGDVGLFERNSVGICVNASRGGVIQAVLEVVSLTVFPELIVEHTID